VIVIKVIKRGNKGESGYLKAYYCLLVALCLGW